MSTRFNGLWRHPNFRLLWAGQTASVFGSLIGGTALGFTAVLFLDASPMEMALISAIRLVAGMVSGPIAGLLADRWRRRPIMVGADLGRAAVLGTIPLAAFLGILRIEQLYVVSFLVGILTVLFDVAYQSYLPSLVRPDELVEGNSKLSASDSVAEISGFSLAGWLVQVFSAPMAILFDAISFLVSAGFIGLIRAKETAAPPAEKGQSMVREASEGLREVWRSPILRALAGCTLIVSLSFQAFGTVFLLYVSREVGFAPATLGMIFAVGGISSLLGAVSADRITRRLGVGSAMIAGLVLMGISQLFIPLTQDTLILGVVFLVAQQLLGDGAYTVYAINQLSLRQTTAPERLLGRVNAGLELIGMGAMLAGSLLGGLLGELVGLRMTLALSAFGTILAALWLLLSPIRSLKASVYSTGET